MKNTVNLFGSSSTSFIWCSSEEALIVQVVLLELQPWPGLLGFFVWPSQNSSTRGHSCSSSQSDVLDFHKKGVNSSLVEISPYWWSYCYVSLRSGGNKWFRCVNDRDVIYLSSVRGRLKDDNVGSHECNFLVETEQGVSCVGIVRDYVECSWGRQVSVGRNNTAIIYYFLALDCWLGRYSV